MKACCVCSEVKPLDDFHRNKKARDGHVNQCKACACERARQWRIDNPEHAKRTQREWYERNREAKIAKSIRAYQADPEGRKAAIYAWQKANPERRREYGQRFRARNSEYERERSLRYYEANKSRWLDYSAVRRARAGTASKETQAYMVRLRLCVCAYCGSDENIEIDHIMPLARGGKHEPANLAPACRTCNRSKGAMTLTEWLGVV